MLEIYQWTLFILFTQINFAVLIIHGCAKKKKGDEPGKLPKYSMKGVGAGGGGGKDENNNNGQSPANTPQSDGKKAGGSSKSKKGSTKDAKKGDGNKEPAKGAVVPALNKDHLVPQVNDAVKTERKGDAGGDKQKLVSNPIVSAVTEQFPTVAQPVKEQIKTDKTQSEAHTDKTQKDA
uniref:Uncharacterized protein n=1 Tax=Panagrolaimus superbus TaxID=310955 RepID=A0A914YSG3_9BILA